jgi:hypothetical protein
MEEGIKTTKQIRIHSCKANSGSKSKTKRKES